MKNYYRYLIFIGLGMFLIFFSCQNKALNSKSTSFINDTLIKTIENRILQGISEYEGNNQLPRSFNGTSVKMTSPGSWTSGFYPGCLWLTWELTDNPYIKAEAEKRTNLVFNEQYNAGDHDVGFKMFCSYGNAIRLSPKAEYRNVLIQSAKTLSTRYNPTVGCIRSWDHHTDKWQFPVIIDNLMNLELIMWAFKQTNDSTFYKIAVTHADKTLQNHFRKDFSSYHVVDYDTITGEVLKKNTYQGYSDESAWARGQAWALYGYTMMYRETELLRYKNVAEKIAGFILNHKNLPNDKVPYWDFNAPDIPEAPRDASSAAIIASALYELSEYSENKKQFRSEADKMLKSLLSPDYFAFNTGQHSFLLDHSTGSLPKNSEIDCPIIYADYYLLEAILRQNR